MFGKVPPTPVIHKTRKSLRGLLGKLKYIKIERFSASCAEGTPKKRMSDDDDFELRRFLMVAHWQRQPVRPRPSSLLVASGDARAQAHSYWKEPQKFPKGSLGDHLQRLPPHILRHIGQYLCNGFEHLMIEQATGYSDLALLSPRHKARIVSGYRVGANNTFVNDLAAMVHFRHIIRLPFDPDVRRKLHWKTIRIPDLYGIFVDALFVWCKAGEVGWGRRDLPFHDVLGPAMAEWKKHVQPFVSHRLMEEWMVVLTMTRKGEWALQIFQFEKRRICKSKNKDCWALFEAETCFGEQWNMWDSPCVAHHVRQYTEIFKANEESRAAPLCYMHGDLKTGNMMRTNSWEYPEDAVYAPWEWSLRRMPLSTVWRRDDLY